MAGSMRQTARPWAGPLARVGFFAKGVVYVLVGGLAVLAAIGKGGQVEGSRGAVRSLGEQPFGDVLLLGAAVGLLAYALWRFLEAAFNLENERGLKGAAKRTAYVVSGLTHSALALLAFKLSQGERPRGHDGAETRSWVARALHAPFGRILLAAVALGLIGYGLFQLYCALVTKFPKSLRIGELRGSARRWVSAIGRLGLASRGVVFVVIGYFLGRAALDRRPGESRDVGGALREIAARPHGEVLLFAVAAGLAAYGLYMIVASRYARAATSQVRRSDSNAA
jgi:hypothetical protein